MRKAERLFQIVNLLRSRRTVITAKTIADALEVSERTIYRDLQALMLSGVPIDGEAGVGYRLAKSYTLPPVMFTESELRALMLGMQMVKAWAGNDMIQSAESAFEKIQAVLPDQQHYRQIQQPSWLMVPDFMRGKMAQFSDDLNDTIDKRQQITIAYQRQDGEHSTRSIHPLGLIYWGKTWTLVAWCLMRDEYRMFRLDRIQAMTRAEIYFDWREDRNLQHYMQQMESKEAQNACPEVNREFS
ncbi:Protein PafB [BD1-7 clade bacterium]|uniref:Protein PafB n=1 Tax=BD1-7 clade bacterium TaxID=2029982 RepID=A0A5S9PHL7_9GAMM|nr:Protein PafB [BD1-7 clade bacterium]